MQREEAGLSREVFTQGSDFLGGGDSEVILIPGASWEKLVRWELVD